jgi:hypothetical protein
MIMRVCRDRFLHKLIAILFALFVFNLVSYAQFNISISGPSGATMQAPTAAFAITATVSANANSLTKMVFYRNDVPYKTFIGSSTSRTITENMLGQDTYIYRARAYDSQGVWKDSSDIKLTVETPRVVKMGGIINGVQTHGPNRNFDHTTEIQAAVNYLGTTQNGLTGGTLYFPCTGAPGGDQQSIYNIGNTITIPSNVTLQGESAEEGIYNGRCRMYLNNNLNTPGCISPDGSLNGKAMFEVLGTKARVRFRDLWLVSRTTGRDCGSTIGTFSQIAADMTNGVRLNASSGGNISDVIFENVSITGFTNGINAFGNSISDIKMRGVRTAGNNRQLKIDAMYAYDWDVQNFNVTYMIKNQGAVEIVRSGIPAFYTGENPKLKFLQLNCNGDGDAAFIDKPEFCVNIKKHGGLYFKQLHYEGTQTGLIVENINAGSNPETNPDPIVLENSVATGEFRDASMKLYLIGNGIIAAPNPQTSLSQNHPDKRRMEFVGAGLQSTVVDCGDVHWDRTDTVARMNPNDPIGYGDWRMAFTHTERNRGSFFLVGGDYSFVKAHTVCPSGVPGLPNINEVGGEHFNVGVMPMEAFLPYSNSIEFSEVGSDCNNASKCSEILQLLLDSQTNRGTLLIKNSVPIDRTIFIPSGRQIVSVPKGELVLSEEGRGYPLLQIDVPPPNRTSGIAIRNLRLRTTTIGENTNGLAIIGGSAGIGASSDMHFSGLTFEGFDKGLVVAPESVHDPMSDGLSWKNLKFINNKTAASLASSNLSNWNVMNLSIDSNSANAAGWYQKTGGSSLQNVTCRATSNTMRDCLELQMAGVYLTGLKNNLNVTNALTIGVNGGLFNAPYNSLQFSNLVLRNNNFSSSNININGKTFLVSMNNKYGSFNVSTASEANLSRVTYCGDTFNVGAPPFEGLLGTHSNLFVGVPTPTRVECGTRPVPWSDAITFGGEEAGAEYQPLVGNFFDAVREDFVIYRKGSSSTPQAQFRIREASASATSSPKIVPWGTIGDVPLTGKFFPGTNAQIVVWRPSSGQWWVYDPNTLTTSVWGWGIPGDIPFVGNFIDESGSVSGNKDEIAVYRPSSSEIWILNPRSGQSINFVRNAGFVGKIQVGDFSGIGYDQIAQYKDGTWNIVDPRNPYPTIQLVVSFGQVDDLPISGKYLSGNCTQLGVWRPSTQKFIVKDPPNCNGYPETQMTWGSNNDFGTTAYPDDIPLRIKTADGSLDRPTAYRTTKGAFPFSISNGQWWVHDPF